MVTILKNYVANAAILVAFTSVIFQVFGSTGLNTSLTLPRKFLAGFLFGLMGVALMFFAIDMPNNLKLDFRTLAMVLAASCGSLPCVLCTLIIASARLLFFGVNSTSLIGVATVLIICLVFCLLIPLRKSDRWKYVVSVCCSIFLQGIAFFIVVQDSALFWLIVLSVLAGTALFAVPFYFYLNFISLLTNAYRQTKRESRLDFLTGVNNVREFDMVYNQAIGKAGKLGENLSILFIDIDHFKEVNDNHGHMQGDVVLRQMGELLRNLCRSSDVVSRNGGEEFSMLLDNCPLEDAAVIAERVRSRVEETSFELTNRAHIHITVSIGVATYPSPVGEIEELVLRADTALYEAKRLGRNRIAFAGPMESITSSQSAKIL